MTFGVIFEKKANTGETETENKNQSWMIDFSNEFQLYYDSDLRRIEPKIGFEEKIK